MKAGKERLLSLDILRVLAAMAVVLMHAVSGVLNGNFDMMGYERRRMAFLAIMDATAWCVPIFLMISGYFLLNPALKMTWRDALIRYCRRVFLALAFFGVPYAILELVSREGGFRIGMIWEATWMTAVGKTWAHMWYLYLILILYAVTPALKWFLGKVPRMAVLVLMGVIVLLTSLLPFASAVLGWGIGFVFPQQAVYLFYYLMGYVFVTLGQGKDTGNAAKKKMGEMGITGNKTSGILCLVFFVVILAAEMESRFLEGYELNMAYAYPPTVLASVLLFGGSIMLEGVKARTKTEEGWETENETSRNALSAMKRWLPKFVPLTFGIYLIHPVFLNFFYKFLRISIMDFRFFIGVPLFFAMAFVGSAVATGLLRLIPPVKRYVL